MAAEGGILADVTVGITMTALVAAVQVREHPPQVDVRGEAQEVQQQRGTAYGKYPFSFRDMLKFDQNFTTQ